MTQRRVLDKNKVADAAREIVKASGMPALTFGNLAKKLGIKSQSVYNYFHNSDELLEYLGADLMHALYEELTTGLIGLSGREALLKYGEIAHQFFLKQGKLVRTIHTIPNYPRDSDFVKAMEQVLQIISQIIDGQKNIKIDRVAFLQAFISQVLGFTLVESMGLFETYDVPHTNESFRRVLEITTDAFV
ncbi:transcriptional regulator [Lapidilactobacillus concavus]|nr:TetR/AcrR family transcriptional regulator [Lapidilactobacillus concavus]GEL12961.1 transcriptional regulator [Lapidilactobacillus concavus]